MSKKQSILNYVIDIKEKITRIKNKIDSVSLNEFSNDTDLQEIIEYNILIIGEAISKIPNDFLLKYKNDRFYWRQISDMRNFLVHQYWGTNLEMVYQVAIEDITELEMYIDKIIEKEKFKNN